MSVQSTKTTDQSGNDREVGTSALPRAKRAGSTVVRYGRSGPAAALAGVALIVRATRTTPYGRKAAGQLLAGAALVGLGIRQRRSDDGTAVDEGRSPKSDEVVSADARAARERHDVVHQSGTNPRGTSGEPDVETRTAPGEGEIRFNEERSGGPEPKPRLDDEGPKDPRFENADDEGVEIDLSEAAMADEASEATGPTPGQAQPVQTEDTEPERSPPKDASHTRADVPGGTSAKSDTESESGEPVGGGGSEGTSNADEKKLADEVIAHLAADEDGNDGSDGDRETS